MSLPTRVDNHRTETRAVRKIIGAISEDWLIRNMDERDYGIDLMFEVFKHRFPTGRIAFVQSKGTESAFENGGDSIILRNFPTKTVEYALRLNAPFFIFYTSLKSGQTVFVWLQRYAQNRLIKSTNWQLSKTVTIYFPPENTLSNLKKIEAILHSEQLAYQTLEILRNIRWLKIHVDSFLEGQSKVASNVLNDLAAIERCNAFLEMILQEGESANFTEIQIVMKKISNSGKILKKISQHYLAS